MKDFSIDDISSQAKVTYGTYQLEGKSVGIRIEVPEILYDQFPFNCTAYQWMQQLRALILDYGFIEIPNLPVNKSNYTLAQRAPQQHTYSTNHYLTDLCQQPHQDTPPYPTAFWLGEERLYSATWVMSNMGVAQFFDVFRRCGDVEETHRQLVTKSIAAGHSLLLNQQPGLLLIDNSHSCSLYHARTCLFDKLAVALAANESLSDTAMYAFNEVGLLNYIDQLDSRRGAEHQDEKAKQEIMQFMQREDLPQLIKSLGKG